LWLESAPGDLIPVCDSLLPATQRIATEIIIPAQHAISSNLSERCLEVIPNRLSEGFVSLLIDTSKSRSANGIPFAPAPNTAFPSSLIFQTIDAPARLP